MGNGITWDWLEERRSDYVHMVNFCPEDTFLKSKNVKQNNDENKKNWPLKVIKYKETCERF